MNSGQEVSRLVGDRGEFVVTERMLLEADASTLSVFQVALTTEAAARGLAVNFDEDILTGDVRVRWKPDPARIARTR